MTHAEHLSFNAEKVGSDRCKVVITIGQPYVEAVYHYILRTRQSAVVTQGFIKGATPFSYVERTFKHNLADHLKEFFFIHCVINFFYKKIIEHKITSAGQPLVKEVSLDPATGATYVFELHQLPLSLKHEWKRLSFKAPMRKNYKDLDRQVEHFLHEEQQRATQSGREEISAGDWIFFVMELVDEQGNRLLPGHSDHAWIRLGDELIDRDAYELFAGKRVGDTFITKNELLQEYVNNGVGVPYLFLISIKDRSSHHVFSVDYFKRQFKLKSARDTHAKLIEIFSYRNDISQRRETVESLFKLLLHHYHFDVPESLTLEQQELLLRGMLDNPDYHVYKMQHDFKRKVSMLAEKQVKEHLLINHVAYEEAVQVPDEDILFYLNLLKRPRTKEFIYFGLPSLKAKGYETPLPQELIRYSCLHEKTLNYLISTLTKR